jgi:hypothetical protein
MLSKISKIALTSISTTHCFESFCSRVIHLMKSKRSNVKDFTTFIPKMLTADGLKEPFCFKLKGKIEDALSEIY